MATRILSLIAPFVVSIAAIACASEQSAELRGLCEFAQFANLNHSERSSLISTCSPEQQVRLYLDWSSYTMPSNTEHADDIARTGKALLPPLLARLEKSEHLRDEIKKPELLVVLEIMQRKGYYAVSEDKEAVSRIERAVSLMNEEHLRDWAADLVSQIKSGQ